MSFPATKHSTEWIKFPKTTEIVFVGRDILALGKGCHLYFFSLSLGTHKIYSATNHQMGDGVQCFTGHRHLPILAFAEKSLNPRIIFLRYSDFEKIKILPDGAPEGYQAIAFSEVEYFITLSSLPEFELIVWNWHTGDKLAVERTNINNTNQFLSVSYHYPVNVVQFHENSSSFLLWEIHFGYKNVILIKNEIKLPYNDTITHVTWNPEGNLYILNKMGCVYTINIELKLNMIIHSAIIGNTTPSFKWYKGGLIVMDLNAQLKHFKKGVEATLDWNINPIKIRRFFTNTTLTGKEYLIGWTESGEILELDIQRQRIISRKDFFSNIIDFCLIYPMCNYFVSLCIDGMSIKVSEALSGKEKNITTIEEKINVITSNPIYPYITIGLFNGTIMFISYYNIEKPTIIAKFNLIDNEINKIVYNETGNLIAAAHMEGGIFFVLRATPNEKIEILSCIDYRKTAIDLAILDTEKSYKLLILVEQPANKYKASNNIHIKMILKSNLKVKKKNYKSDRLITKLIVLNNKFIAKIFDENNLVIFQLHKKSIKFTTQIICKNHPFYYILKTNGRNIFTCSVNGLLTILKEDYSEMLAAFLVHHRKDGGILNALVDTHLRFILTLGQENELVYTKITQNLFDENKYKVAQNIFDNFTQFPEIEPGKTDSTYIEKIHRTKILNEQNKYAKERKDIMDEFILLKNEIISLFEENLYGPENEKIYIFEFNLHTNLKEHKEKLCEQECEWIRKYYNELIRAQSELWEHLKKKFWDTQLIKRSIINGIFSNFHVENYGLVPENSTFQSNSKYILMLREFEDMLRVGDMLLPWATYSQSELKKNMAKRPSLEYIDDKQLYSEEYPSSLAPQFLNASSFYNQEEIHTFTQSYFQKYLINQTSIQLRQLFNKTYNEVIGKKRQIMKSIIEMNARLRFILSELEITNISIIDPEWHLAEIPENIITIQNLELTEKPYISESCQALLDEQTAEEERIRLILLADDFREKTLTRIMDGLLEVRWEDTLKWDVVKPQCMFDKKPEKYNTEERRVVNEYEEKLKFLNSERLRYRNILQNEYTEISETVRNRIKNFNSELSELSLFKIKIETARLHHCLMMQLMQDVCFKRKDLEQKERTLRDEIKRWDKRITWINNKLSELIDASNDCKLFAETLSIKDKTIEKNFKKDILDYSALVQEQGFKLFKKQPKGNFTNVNSPTLLNELGVCVVSQEKSQLVTSDCLEFLKSVDKLDEYVGVPNSIDETVYKIICKYRRQRIEVEIRTKANQLDQIDIDSSVQYFQKLLNDKKESAAQHLIELSNLRMKKNELVHDKLLQIVVKRGSVEIPTSGFIADYDCAILVDRHEIEKVNSIIQNAGQRKIQILKNILIHRREITQKEWEHKKKRMEIEDLQEFLYMIQNIKVTKELQHYLNQKEKSELLQKNLLQIDQDFKSTRKTYDRILEERNKAINELNKQILEYKKKNYILDKKVSDLNVDICEHELTRDIEFEVNYKTALEKRMKSIIKRSALIKTIQEQHNEILVLRTELELARLKTYPTLKMKAMQ